MVPPSVTDPYVVEWDPADKGALETRLRRGLVPVSYDGCQMHVVKRCTVTEGRYVYAPYMSTKTDELRIGSIDELVTKLPLCVLRLQAQLERYQTLGVQMAQVGRYESSVNFVSHDMLHGECDDVTHVVWGATVGAHEVNAAHGGEGGAEVGVGPAGIGGKGSRAQASLFHDGRIAACAAAQASDASPPEGCGALLRVEVIELGDVPPRRVACPSGSEWDGDECMWTSVTCPDDRKWDGERCVPSAGSGRIAVSGADSLAGALPPGSMIGVAHGLGRARQAEQIADAIRRLKIPLDDVWEVDPWGDADECLDRVAYYKDEYKDWARQMAGAVAPQLPAEKSDSDSPYHVIIQLCPVR